MISSPMIVRPLPVLPSTQFRGQPSVSAQAEANRQQCETKRLQDKAATILDILASPQLRVGEKEFTGIQLLQLIWEIGHTFGTADTVYLTSKLGKILYSERTVDQSALYNVASQLHAAEVVDYNSYYQGVKVTDHGKRLIQALKKYKLPATREGIQQALTYMIHPPKAGSSWWRRSLPVSQPARDAQLLALTATVSGNRSGWEVLKTIHRLEQQQSFLQRAWQPGIEQRRFCSASIDPASPEGRQASRTLNELAQAGFLKQHGPDRWSLTRQARALLKHANPIQALQVSDKELATILTSQRTAIEAERKQRANRLAEWERQLSQSRLQLQQLRQALQTAEAEAIRLHDQMERSSEPAERQRLALEAAGKVSFIKLQEQAIPQKASLIEHQETLLRAAILRDQLWGQQAHARLEKIQEAEHQLEKARLIEENAKLVEDIAELEGPQTQEGIHQQLLILLQRAQETAIKGEVRGEVTQEDARLRAAQALYGVNLESAVAELKAKQAGQSSEPLAQLAAQQRRADSAGEPPQISF